MVPAYNFPYLICWAEWIYYEPNELFLRNIRELQRLEKFRIFNKHKVHLQPSDTSN